MRSRHLLVAGLAVGLFAAGCSSPLYRPHRSGVGYSEAELAPAVFEVAFQARASTSFGDATELAKVRAAELAVREGKTHFVILGRDVGQATDVEFDPGFRGGYGVGHDRRGGLDVGIGYGGRFDVETRPFSLLRVRLLGEPQPDAFAADEVLREAVDRGLVRAEDVSVSQAPTTRTAK
jgi:hypothetical protein